MPYKDGTKRKDYARLYARPFKVERQAFYGARRRCIDTTRKGYARYGGRGIEFRFHTFEEFIDALRTADNPSGMRPSTGHSLDRINTNGHYEAGNVRWALADVQAANRNPETRVRSTRGVPWTPAQRLARATARVRPREY